MAFSMALGSLAHTMGDSNLQNVAFNHTCGKACCTYPSNVRAFCKMQCMLITSLLHNDVCHQNIETRCMRQKINATPWYVSIHMDYGMVVPYKARHELNYHDDSKVDNCRTSFPPL